MRICLQSSRMRRRMALALAIVIFATVAMRPASAGFFDFLFGTPDHAAEEKARSAAQQTNGFANSTGDRPTQTPIGGGYARSTGHCVRLCDGKHFPLHGRGEMSPTAMCRAFCPASVTKVFFGSQIDRAISMDGERYSELANAFAYRKKLSSDCTCNGREPAGLAPVDFSLDTTLRPGDVVATTTGLFAFSGSRSGGPEAGDFTPVANYPGLTAATRARLGEMKIAPVATEETEDYTGTVHSTPSTSQPRASLN
ncbi:DUF2865 domain-containing protein [Bradyrhizobium sp. LHD-71]|uniref:DUF2865 domain-containing protein n=1 Tax=Bradyrhizobium sp. LHD-71 TaxID=3072141 RepID=UPI00280E49E2|nr:DUF2865 domain-containing protein [Bradyrhizobium sp. LHD-71]MDQ8727284.1 DUF2865 domain-containing protein [Bradyrhizobium sp. LHD-71]